MRFLGLDLVQDSVKFALLVFRPIYRSRVGRLDCGAAELLRSLQVYLQNLHNVGWPKLLEEVFVLKILDGPLVGDGHKLVEAPPYKLHLTGLAGGLLPDGLFYP